MDDRVSRLSELTYYRGRVALHAMLKALGISDGDNVALQAFTCLAMPEGIYATGAEPLYVDIEKDGVNMDPDDLARKLTPNTKALVVQHTFGVPADLGALMAIAEERGIPVIEDCCHTFASTYDGQTVGSFGVGAFYSFEWGKPLVAGIGGSAVVNDTEIKAKVEEAYSLLEEPSNKSLLKIQIQYAGYNVVYSPRRFWKVRAAFQKLSASGAVEGNYNKTSADGETAVDFRRKMAAPLRKRLETKIETADEVTEHARKITEIYKTRITGGTFIRPTAPEQANTVYARYPLFTERKDELLAAAEAANVEVADWYSTPIHPLKQNDWAAIGYVAGSCPVAEQAAAKIVSMPVNKKTSEAEANRIAEFLHSFGS